MITFLDISWGTAGGEHRNVAMGRLDFHVELCIDKSAIDVPREGLRESTQHQSNVTHPSILCTLQPPVYIKTNRRNSKRRNSIANAVKLGLFCINPSKYSAPAWPHKVSPVAMGVGMHHASVHHVSMELSLYTKINMQRKRGNQCTLG